MTVTPMINYFGYLFDGANSSIGGEANRFSDGGGYFIYRFEPPAGTTSLVVTVTMWNQYLVTITDTAPTRVEPFPYAYEVLNMLGFKTPRNYDASFYSWAGDSSLPIEK